MKLKVLNLNKTETKTIDLPIQFYEPVRIDLIRKAFLVIQSNKRQPYGAHPEAGKRASAGRCLRKHPGWYQRSRSRFEHRVRQLHDGTVLW